AVFDADCDLRRDSFGACGDRDLRGHQLFSHATDTGDRNQDGARGGAFESADDGGATGDGAHRHGPCDWNNGFTSLQCGSGQGACGPSVRCQREGSLGFSCDPLRACAGGAGLELPAGASRHACRPDAGAQGRVTTPILMTRQDAWELLCEYTKGDSLRKHALAVEAVMRCYARKLCEGEGEWGGTRMLHDFD